MQSSFYNRQTIHYLRGRACQTSSLRDFDSSHSLHDVLILDALQG